MKFTLITACYNSAGTIRTALASVAAQRLDSVELEYIVVDGGSTDGTVELIRAYEQALPSSSSKFTFRWLSERDRGLYDALNKGIRMASGEVIGILNADDVLATDDILAQVAARWNDSLDATYGDIRFVNDDHSSATLASDSERLAVLRSAPSCRYCTGRFFRPWQMRFGVQVAHPSFFCRREVFMRLGPYLTDFGMYADFELLVRYLVKSRIRTAYLPICTTVMRSGGASTNGLVSTVRITRSDCAALLRNGVWTCIPLLLLRLPVKLLGVILSRRRQRAPRGGSRPPCALSRDCDTTRVCHFAD